MLPIPGTSSAEHLRANVAAAGVELTDDQYEALSAATGG
jgi:pyridoxine 4-dehydrogenase